MATLVWSSVPEIPDSRHISFGTTCLPRGQGLSAEIFLPLSTAVTGFRNGQTPPMARVSLLHWKLRVSGFQPTVCHSVSKLAELRSRLFSNRAQPTPSRSLLTLTIQHRELTSIP